MKDLNNTTMEDAHQLIDETIKILAGIKSLVIVLTGTDLYAQPIDILQNYFRVMNNLILQAEDCCEQLTFALSLKTTSVEN